VLSDLSSAVGPPHHVGGGGGFGALAADGDEEREMEEELRELEEQEARQKAAAAAVSKPAETTARRVPAKGKDGKPTFDVQIKLLMLGDSGVGKTSLLTRYAEGKFVSDILATAGVAFQTQYVEVEGRTIRLDIWDTAGQEKFHVITQAYYAGAHGIILVYDASDAGETSFNSEYRSTSRAGGVLCQCVCLQMCGTG
jgi:hypothetical protein